MSKEQFDELNHVESVVKQFLLNNFNMKLRAQFFYNHIFGISTRFRCSKSTCRFGLKAEYNIEKKQCEITFKNPCEHFNLDRRKSKSFKFILRFRSLKLNSI